MMQLCASAAKLRDGGPILPFGMKAMETHRDPATSNHHRRPRHRWTVWAETVGCLQRPPFMMRDAERRRPAPRPLARTATRRSEGAMTDAYGMLGRGAGMNWARIASAQ